MKGPYEALLKTALQQQVSASSWFTASARSGALDEPPRSDEPPALSDEAPALTNPQL